MICDDCLQDTTESWVDDECRESQDGAHHPARCLEQSEHCAGPIALWHSGGTYGRSWPRCTFHGERRLDRYENSIERYADSDCVPDWFDPAYAGERWEDD